MKKDWTLVPFEEVCASMMKGPFGSDIKKSLYVPKSDDAYKVYIQANAIEKDASIGDYYISKEYFDTKMYRFEVKPNDYIITCDGTLGKFLRLPQTIERGIISASLLRITLNSRIVPKFFEYLWDGYVMERLTSDIRNSALVHLPSASKIGKVEIPLPPLAEQERIVAELDLLSGIIDKQKAQLKELDTFAQSIFYDMFGNPVENEKGWSKTTIDMVCSSIVRGPFGSALKKEYFVERDATTYKVYEQKHAIQKNANIGSYYISEERYQTLKRFEVRGGDIIMSCSGTIGELYEIPFGSERGIMNQALLKFTLNDTVNKTYFLFAMDCVKESFETKGTGLQNIGSVGTIKKTNIALPPITLQQSFASKIELIEQQKSNINQSIAESQKLFDYTMDKYFS